MKVAEAGSLSAALSNTTLDDIKDELYEQFRDIDHEYHLRDSLFHIRQTSPCRNILHASAGFILS